MREEARSLRRHGSWMSDMLFLSLWYSIMYIKYLLQFDILSHMAWGEIPTSTLSAFTFSWPIEISCASNTKPIGSPSDLPVLGYRCDPYSKPLKIDTSCELSPTPKLLLLLALQYTLWSFSTFSEGFCGRLLPVTRGSKRSDSFWFLYFSYLFPSLELFCIWLNIPLNFVEIIPFT